jgi:hypothetical protein
MKKRLLSASLFVVSAAAIAQLPKVQMPSKASVEKKAEAQKDAMYMQLIGKDVATVMKTFNMKDSIGKTKYAYIPQVEKGTRYLLLAIPNGDELAF